jgi:hypothetical protein
MSHMGHKLSRPIRYLIRTLAVLLPSIPTDILEPIKSEGGDHPITALH